MDDDGWCYSSPLPRASKPTLVLDMDYTLVCVKGEGGDLDVVMRPGLDQFLSDMARLYELVLWTSGSREDYAAEIMRKVESQGPLFSYKISSEDIFGNDLTKDLRKLGRDLNQVVIVEDSRDAIASEVIGNAIIIESYEGKGDDNGRLAKLGSVLKVLVDSKNFRRKLKHLRAQGALREIEQTEDRMDEDDNEERSEDVDNEDEGYDGMDEQSEDDDNEDEDSF